MQENLYSSRTLPSFFVDLDIHLGVPLTSPFKTKEADQQASPLKYIISGASPPPPIGLALARSRSDLGRASRSFSQEPLHSFLLQYQNPTTHKANTSHFILDSVTSEES